MSTAPFPKSNHRRRNRSAAKLGAKLVTSLKKGVPKRTKVSYDSEHRKVSVFHKAASR